jgi:hypothetical protein
LGTPKSTSSTLRAPLRSRGETRGDQRPAAQLLACFTYLDQDDLPREFYRDEYITVGDIGHVDEEGFSTFLTVPMTWSSPAAHVYQSAAKSALADTLRPR